MPHPAPQLQPSAADLQRLAPIRLRRSCHGLVGRSRHAANLRRAVSNCQHAGAAAPVLLIGEPGLEKENLVALIHYGSPSRQAPLLRLEGERLRPGGDDLFAPAGDGQDSLLACISRCGASLLIAGLDRVPPPLAQRLLDLAATGRWQEGDGQEAHSFGGRLFFSAESSPALATAIGEEAPNGMAWQVIKVPPLRAHRQDLEAWAGFELRRQARRLGWSHPPKPSQELLHQLLSDDLPGNHHDLSQRIETSLRRWAHAQPALLPAATATAANSPPRFDLWRWQPALRRITRLPAAWQRLGAALVATSFVLLNLWLWLGPVQRSGNGALVLFWAWWWPLTLLSLPLVGRLWCAVCPFMVWGDCCQALARHSPWKPGRWPRGEIDRWAAPALAAGFAAILLWEELADLPNNARLSSMLLLLITAGAVICSLRFEKRFWCRFLCPVGGMNGLFAKLSITELRARLGICSGSCSSYFCCKGDPSQASLRGRSGCPEGYHPGHLVDNRNCVLCLTCASVCPHGSVQLRLRPPGADLQPSMAPPAGEAGLILVLAGGITLHHWQRLLGWCPLTPSSLQQGPWLARLSIAVLALALPAAAYLALRLIWSLARRWHQAPPPAATGDDDPGEAKPRPQWLLLYSLMPLLWSLLLARHLPLGLTEAGRLLPQTFAPLESAWVGTLPHWSADSHGVGFCQSLAVLIGVAGSLVLVRRLLQPALGPGLLFSGLAVALGIGGRLLVAG